MLQPGSLLSYGTTISPLGSDPVEDLRDAYTGFKTGNSDHSRMKYSKDFLKQDPFQSSFVFKFHPDNCRRTSTSKERNVIGISSNSGSLASQLSNDLT